MKKSEKNTTAEMKKFMERTKSKVLFADKVARAKAFIAHNGLPNFQKV